MLLPAPQEITIDSGRDTYGQKGDLDHRSIYYALQHTTAGDSYVIRFSENEDMSGAKTRVIKGAGNTSYVIGGLKKGKTYYISIRVRKTVDGINYYTTFGVAKKIKVER